MPIRLHTALTALVWHLWRQALRATALLGVASLVQAHAAAAPTLAACDAGFEAVLHAAPSAAPALPAQALWLDGQHLRWLGVTAPVDTATARWRLHHSATAQIVALPGQPVQGASGSLALQVSGTTLPPSVLQRFAWAGSGVQLALVGPAVAQIKALHQHQLVLVQEDAQGRVQKATRVQHAGALDDLFAAAENHASLGATVGKQRTRFALWAPTAQRVALCLHTSGTAPARQLLPLVRDSATGVWQAQLPQDLTGQFYTYLVDVVVPGVGLVRNRVTDPYALSLTTDSRLTWVGSLNAPALKPPGWDDPRLRSASRQRVQAPTDMVIYELHVRDFSVGDNTVPAEHRGKYMAFTHSGSDGMRHLQALSRAGLTDVHLLPIFDLATVPEVGCTPGVPPAGAAPNGESQQAAVMAAARTDCFNWGYDPYHYTAPEGSYATNPADGATRVLELRRMVQALHAAGLRVGMDVVYNHTTASGQKEKSVLDRIVPGYYQRLNADGAVEMSTCCDNTATEHRMMAKLMIDSAVVWARDHHIDSFRFDLMGHQPRSVMLRLQKAVDAAAGRPVQLIGEGWNFGEVENGKRFVQASQLGLNNASDAARTTPSIGTFSDRARDATRGGGCCDNAEQTVQRQGWLNGLHFAPNGRAPQPATAQDLMQAADGVRVGLAGTLRSYRMQGFDGTTVPLLEMKYAGQSAGYAYQPGDVVNYVENHDNHTLFDSGALKLPQGTSAEDRARVQVLGMALTAFSQGIAYYHAGIEVLRSKSGDRNSYDSGDWFNRLDWTLTTNHWGTGLPPKQDNAEMWPVLAPLLADPAIAPSPAHIRFARDAFLDLLAIRNSTPLFRLRTAADVQQRLTLLNTGPQQQPTVVVGHLDGRGWPAAAGPVGFAEVLYVVNAGTTASRLVLPTLQGRAFELHPVHLAATAGDKRVAAQARWDASSGTLLVPARSALVYVLR
jgi:pullulanase